MPIGFAVYGAEMLQRSQVGRWRIILPSARMPLMPHKVNATRRHRFAKKRYRRGLIGQSDSRGPEVLERLKEFSTWEVRPSPRPRQGETSLTARGIAYGNTNCGAPLLAWSQTWPLR